MEIHLLLVLISLLNQTLLYERFDNRIDDVILIFDGSTEFGAHLFGIANLDGIVEIGQF